MVCSDRLDLLGRCLFDAVHASERSEKLCLRTDTNVWSYDPVDTRDSHLLLGTLCCCSSIFAASIYYVVLYETYGRKWIGASQMLAVVWRSLNRFLVIKLLKANCDRKEKFQHLLKSLEKLLLQIIPHNWFWFEYCKNAPLTSNGAFAFRLTALVFNDRLDDRDVLVFFAFPVDS